MTVLPLPPPRTPLRSHVGANAALLAAAILANKYPEYGERLDALRAAQTAKVLDRPDPRLP